MELIPKLPPGRANRKALAFGTEIHRLRAAGYTFEAIRLTLREAGVQVSCTTVKREAAKRPAVAPVALQVHSPVPALPASASVTSTALQEPARESRPAGSFVGDRRSGKEIAEAFMKSQITNPLMQERIRHEGRRP